jgi:ribosomal protein S18 acetylase RimI-like enzyme
MTVGWRARTLERPEYLPDLDLVVEAPDGRLAGFCVCWISTDEQGHALSGQVEPLGVHPDFREKGLGRGLLLEGIRRMQQRDVATMIVETDDDRDAAVALYTSAGFVVTEKLLIYRKDAVDAD